VDELVQKANDRKHRMTLFVLVVDECHCAAESSAQQDKIINRPELWDAKHDNIIVLLCSATPYVALTRDSAVPERYRWGPDGSVIWVDGVGGKAWLEDRATGAPLWESEIPSSEVFVAGGSHHVQPSLGDELNVVIWRDVVGGDFGNYCGLDDILRSSHTHAVLGLKRWAVDEARFEKLVVFAAATAPAAAPAPAPAAGRRRQQRQSSFQRAELLAADYAFSLLCRYFSPKAGPKADHDESVLFAAFVRLQTGKEFDFWPALRVLLLFECEFHGDAAESIRLRLGQLPTAGSKLTDIDAIAADLQQFFRLQPQRVALYPNTLTDEAVDALFLRPVMQVIRVPDKSESADGIAWGVKIPDYLTRVRDQLAMLPDDELLLDGVTPVSCPRVQFEIVRDLSNEDVSETMRPRFFFELQKAKNMAEGQQAVYTQHACQHVTAKSGRCPCQNNIDGADRETFRFHPFEPSSRLSACISAGKPMPGGTDPGQYRKCALKGCKHVHIRVDSFADLVPARAENENSDVARPILLILVDKGRLGDTFPSTFECMDMRARPNIRLLDSAVQELGRLCRYSSGSATPPYALVAPVLERHLAAADGSLQKLIANKCNENEVDEYISRIGGAQPIEASDSQSLVAHLRRNFQAYSSTKAKAGDQDRTGSYDIDRSQSQPSTSFFRNGSEDPQRAPEGQKPRWHKRRFLLFGEPQIGKTAALVHCIAALGARARQTDVDVLLSDDDSDDSDDGCEGAASTSTGYPDVNALRAIRFQHDKASPANGDYGDPACDAVWEHYQDGWRGDELDSALKVPSEGNRGLKEKPDKRCAGAAEATQQPATARMSLVPYLDGRRGEGPPAPERLAPVQISFQPGEAGWLHISAAQAACWNLDGTVRLQIPEDDFCQLPIFMLSYKAGRAAQLCLDKQFVGRSYVQVVCIYPASVIGQAIYNEYLTHPDFADVSFFVHPEVAFDEQRRLRAPRSAASSSAAGGDYFSSVGHSRYSAHRFAAAVCSGTRHRCYVMHDDNVAGWKRFNLRSGTSVSASLSTVLRYFETGLGLLGDDPQPGMRDIAMFGFHSWHGATQDSPACLQRRSPFLRKHVMKVLIINLDLLESFNFQPQMHAMEDLDFNLRISGKTRRSGGGSEYVSPNAAATTNIICKCSEFAFLRSFGGGGVPKPTAAPKSAEVNLVPWADLSKDQKKLLTDSLEYGPWEDEFREQMQRWWTHGVSRSRLEQLGADAPAAAASHPTASGTSHPSQAPAAAAAARPAPAPAPALAPASGDSKADSSSDESDNLPLTKRARR